MAHIGAIEELESRGFEIAAVAGTSMGALVGGMYASGHLEAFKKWMCSLDKYKVFGLVDFTLSSEGLVKGDEASGSYLDGNGNSQPVSNQGEVFAPYVTKQVELGAKLDTGRFGGTVALFQARKPVAGVEGTRFVGSAYKQTNRGIEATVFGEATRGLRLLGGATYLHTDVQGDDAVGAPKWQLNANADWDVPGVPGLALTGRVTYTGKQYADAANTLTVKSWTRLDVGARYGLTLAKRNVTLRANVNNLTNRDYWASVGGFPGANYLVLGEPRTVVLSASVDF